MAIFLVSVGCKDPIIFFFAVDPAFEGNAVASMCAWRNSMRCIRVAVYASRAVGKRRVLGVGWYLEDHPI